MLQHPKPLNLQRSSKLLGPPETPGAARRHPFPVLHRGRRLGGRKRGAWAPLLKGLVALLTDCWIRETLGARSRTPVFNLTWPGGSRGAQGRGSHSGASAYGLRRREPKSAGRPGRRPGGGAGLCSPPGGQRRARVARSRGALQPGHCGGGDQGARPLLLPLRRRRVFRRRGLSAARGGAGPGGFDFGADTAPGAEQRRGGGEERPAVAQTARSGPWWLRGAAGRPGWGEACPGGGAWLPAGPSWSIQDAGEQGLPAASASSVLRADCDSFFFFFAESRALALTFFFAQRKCGLSLP